MDRFPKQNQNSILVKTFPLILNIPLCASLTNFVLCLKTYLGNFHAHISCVGKQGKLVWVLSFYQL